MHSAQVIWLKHGGSEMSMINEACKSLPEYTATLTQRPDGNVLLTLRIDESLALRKVIDGKAISSETCVNALIHDLVRDVKLSGGNVRWNGKENNWVKAKLPTFTGEPIQLTASKSLFSRRKIKKPSSK